MEIRRSPNCGNAPKNLFVEELAVAISTQDLEGVSSSISDQVQWRVVGRFTVRGRQAFIKALPEICPRKAKALQIHRVVSHGRAGAVNGELELNSGEVVEFCHVFEFTNTKGTAVGQVTSYMIGP